MNIALISSDINLGHKAANLAAIRDYIANINVDIDIAVLPELFSTGYSSNKEKLHDWAEGNDDYTIATLQHIAKKHNLAIAGSFLAKTNDAICNRAFFIEPSGDKTFYDKRHLFSISSESKMLTAGQNLPPIVRYRGWNISIAVCYDLRFPAWCRSHGQSYDLLIIPANWPESRKYAWDHLLIARAIENQAYIIGVNRSGEDKFGKYDEMSAAYSYTGREIERRRISKNVEIASIELNPLIKYREEFPFWKDGDTYNITDI